MRTISRKSSPICSIGRSRNDSSIDNPLKKTNYLLRTFLFLSNSVDRKMRIEHEILRFAGRFGLVAAKPIITTSGGRHCQALREEIDQFSIYRDNVTCCSALDKIIIQGYKALQLQYFFTAGHDEVKAWTIQVMI